MTIYVRGNDLAEIKRLYGQQVSFVGGVDQPNVPRAGTPEQVGDEVQLRLDQLAPGGGLLLCPSQTIPDNWSGGERRDRVRDGTPVWRVPAKVTYVCLQNVSQDIPHTSVSD